MNRTSRLGRITKKMTYVMLSLCLLLALGNATVVHAGVTIDNSSIACSSGMSSPRLYAGADISAAGGIYVLVGVTTYGGVTVNVSDTKGSTYTLVNTSQNPSGFVKTHVFLAQLAGNMTAWTDYIDINTGIYSADACAIVICGLQVNPLDGSAIGSNNWSTAMSTAAVTPSTSNTLLVGVFGWSTNTYSAAPGTNWTEQKEAGVLQIETRQVSSGSYAATANLDYVDRWAGVEVALKIRPAQSPTDITLSNNTIAAADTPGTVGTLAAVDPDTCGDETYTFSLVSGDGDTNNGSFTIAGNELKTNASLAPGTYSIRVNVNDGTNNFAKAFSIIVSAYPAITGGDTSWGDYMTNVTFAGINHDSGDDDGYADYTAFAASVNVESTYTLFCTINVGSSTYPAVVVAWIDWNHNYSFEDAEKYVIGTNLGGTKTAGGDAPSGLDTASAEIAVPAGALEGTTRMRIVMNALDGTNEPPNAGGTEFWGDAEDYTVNIGPTAVTLSSLDAQSPDMRQLVAVGLFAGLAVSVCAGLFLIVSKRPTSG
ncbi:MAG: cadherin repeat domain-containing protein [Chloroflexi bacterium]|nr:cadherin repeat domain-containing protein [Chloroflexota bacterium]MBU1750976.1 cadherin repeat domain-containing protein [Chloroflexota bacterium]